MTQARARDISTEARTCVSESRQSRQKWIIPTVRASRFTLTRDSLRDRVLSVRLWEKPRRARRTCSTEVRFPQLLARNAENSVRHSTRPYSFGNGFRIILALLLAFRLTAGAAPGHACPARDRDRRNCLIEKTHFFHGCHSESPYLTLAGHAAALCGGVSSRNSPK